MPRVPDEPNVGVRKPDLRSFDRGNSSQGAYEDRHPHEVQARVVGDTDLLRGVDVHLFGTQVPVVARRGARRHAPAQDLEEVRPEERHPRCIPPHAGFADRKARGFERAGLGVALEGELRAGHEVVALAQQHVAAPVDLLRAEIVGKEVGDHGFTAGSQLDAPARLDPRLRALEAVRPQEERAAVRAFERQRSALPGLRGRGRRSAFQLARHAQRRLARLRFGRRANGSASERCCEREPKPGRREHAGESTAVVC